MKKSKWTSAQIKMLLQKTENSGARMRAFKEVADATGRKPNSVRNYYYKFHAENKNQIVPFNKSETANLLREIILGTSRGESVRSICLRISNNDRAKMLRLQNKYRSVLAKNPEQMNGIVKNLEAQGFLVKSPVTSQARIIQMPKPQNKDEHLSDTDINNLFMGLVRMIKKSASDERVEILKAEIERLRIKVKDLAK